MAYQLQDAWVECGGRRLLNDLGWSIQSGRVTVVAGPVGTGKSSLLKLLSGRKTSETATGGSWVYDGEPLEHYWNRSSPPKSVAWVPQVRHAPAGTFERSRLPDVLSRIETAMVCGARTLLFDEPTRGLPQADVQRLVSDLRGHASQGKTVVVVTHDVGFARDVADDVVLLLGGRCDSCCTAERFFNAPPTAAARNFIDHGACAPQIPPPPPLPKHFQWFLDDTLGGMAKPGLLGDVDDELFAVAASGVKLIVSVIEQPLNSALLRPYGLVGHHVVCQDMGVPSVRETLQACRLVVQTLQRDEKVAVHCRAGLGRTGTLVACILLHFGRSPDQAIAEVREVSPRYIQSDAQVRFIAEIGRELGT